MKNLINFFFSFDKLMKEKLVIPFFWLALIVWGLNFFSTALASIQLRPLAQLVNFVNFFAQILLALVTIRLLSELAVALFRINDNLSPDGGRSETADIDPISEARKAAEAAALRARAATKSAVDKTKSTAAPANTAKASPAKTAATSKKTTTKKTSTKATPAKKTAAKKTAARKTTAKKATSKKAATKTSSAKKTVAKRTATKKKPSAKKA